jgi:hypothetical protein
LKTTTIAQVRPAGVKAKRRRRRSLYQAYREYAKIIADPEHQFSPGVGNQIAERLLLGYRLHMRRLDGPNILDTASGLRLREIAIVVATVAALCVVAGIVLL